MTPVADSIITTLSLYQSLAHETLISIEVHHGYDRHDVLCALEDLILMQRVAVDGDSLSLIALPEDEAVPQAALAIADQYRRDHQPTVSDRLCALLRRAWNWCVDTFDRVSGRIWGPLITLWVVTWFTVGLCAEEMPAWVLPGILDRESSSYRTGATIVYVDQSEGDAGELGPFQMRRAAFDQVKRSGEYFERLATDTAFAQELAVRYLHWLRARQPSWFDAVGRYNTGLGGHYPTAWRYAKDVQRRGERTQ